GAIDLTSHTCFYHTELGWIYLGWEDRHSLWGWIERLGWIYTSRLTYPLCFSQQHQEWMLAENLPGEEEFSFTGLDSRGVIRFPAAAGFNVAKWLKSGLMSAVPEPPQFPPTTSAPSFEPQLSQAVRLLQGPGAGSWRLIAHGAPARTIDLHDSTDLIHWWWRDSVETIDNGPVIFECSSGESSQFWRIDRATGP
ncbi:MAG: hypothetical protein ACO3RV_02750, partial [Luteolibacter sp.]